MMLCLSFDVCTMNHTKGMAFQGQKNSFACVEALSWKRVLALTSSINYFSARYLNNLNMKNSFQKLLKVLNQVWKIKLIQLLSLFRPINNYQVSIINVIQALTRKTTADQVVEGLKSECRGDLSVAAEMSNQTLLWASTTDQSQRNQASPFLRVTFSFSQFRTRVFCPPTHWKAATDAAFSNWLRH